MTEEKDQPEQAQAPADAQGSATLDMAPKSEGSENVQEAAGALLLDDRKARMQAAAKLVNEKKFLEALSIYLSVKQEDPNHRDAVYGIGFCYYKLGYYDKAEWLLQHAHEMEHPNAIRLLRKLEQRKQEQENEEAAEGG